MGCGCTERRVRRRNPGNFRDPCRKFFDLIPTSGDGGQDEHPMRLWQTCFMALGIIGAPAFAENAGKSIRLVMPYPVTGSFEIAGTVRTNKVITVMKSYGAPALTDVIAAQLQRALVGSLGQHVLVERRSRMQSLEAARYVVHAAPDGYTLLLSGSSEVFRHRNVYDPSAEDVGPAIVPVAMFARMPFVLIARTALTLRNARDLVQLARLKPGQLSLGSAGESSIGWFVARRFAEMAGVSFLHVPFNGGTTAASAIIKNETDVAIVALPAILPLLASSRVRVLGIADLERHPIIPLVSTISEEGLKNFEIFGWYGVFAPAGTARSVLDRMSAAIAASTRQENTRALLVSQGLRSSYLPTPAFRAMVRALITGG